MKARGFVLLEVMVAVLIFALGVLSLGKCVNNCLSAERYKEEDARAGRLLANRMAEIEGGSIALNDSSTEELKGMWEGMKLKTTRSVLKKKNENGQDITGVYAVRLELLWRNDNQDHSRELTFYVYPRQQ